MSKVRPSQPAGISKSHHTIIIVMYQIQSRVPLMEDKPLAIVELAQNLHPLLHAEGL